MADLSFRPDPEPHAPPAGPTKPPAPAWVAGLKGGLLTALRFLCSAAILVILIAGLAVLGGGVRQANMKLDRMQRRLDELEKKIGDRKADEPKAMPPAD